MKHKVPCLLYEKWTVVDELRFRNGSDLEF